MQEDCAMRDLALVPALYWLVGRYDRCREEILIGKLAEATPLSVPASQYLANLHTHC
jgi:hypothetical protein